jgi:hypothetical protein
LILRPAVRGLDRLPAASVARITAT